MKNSVFIIILLFSAIAATAQVTSRKLNTTPAVLPNSSTVLIKKDSTPVNKAANNGAMVKTQNAGVSVKPVQSTQMPSRDLKPANYGNKYNDVNQQMGANAAVTGVYTQQIRSGGVPVTVSYKLSKTLSAANISNNYGSDRGRVNYQAKEKKASSEEDWNCSSEQLKVSILDDSYMKINYEAQAANIWPGAIYKFSKFISGGNDETGGRNPVVISTSNPNTSGAVTERLEQPNLDEARQAIANLYGRFTRNPADISVSSMQIHSEEVRSAAELDIKIGVSGYGGGFSGSNNFRFSKNEHSHIFLFDCTKEMFSMDVRQPNEGFFTDPARATADMMYISSVTYGQRVLALVEITADNETINNNFKASYNAMMAGGSGSIDIASSISNGKAVVNMFVVGGQSEKSFPAFSITEMKTRLQEIIRSLTYTTAKPIRYTFKNMKDEVVKYSSATDYFYNKSCEPKSEDEKPATVKVKIASIHIDQMDKDDVDLYGTIYAEVKDASGNRIWEGYSKYLMSLNEKDYIRRAELKSYSQQNLPLKEIQINVPAGKVPGATLVVYYGLMDRDDFGDDEIKMRGQYNKPGGFNFQEIQLDALKRGDQKRYSAQFTDNDGDYPFTITIDVTKGN